MPHRLLRSRSASSCRTSASGRSGSLLGGGKRAGRRRRLLGRTISLGVERRNSELNILGHDAIVSTEYTLKRIQETQANARVTKLELEDVVSREDDQEAVFAAVQNLLARDSHRSWRYIKFIDSIPISSGCDADNLWRKYATKRQTLCHLLGRHAKNKPVMFEVKLEVAAGASVDEMPCMFRTIQGLQTVTRIDFGGALYGCHKPDIPDKLVELFGGGSREDKRSQEEGFCLQEMILFALFCTTPDSVPVNKATAFLNASRIKLKTMLQPKPTPTIRNKQRNREHGGGKESHQFGSLDRPEKGEENMANSHKGETVHNTTSSDHGQRTGLMTSEHSSSSSMTNSNTSRHSTTTSSRRIRRRCALDGSSRRSTRSIRRTRSLIEHGSPDYNWKMRHSDHANSVKTSRPDFRWDRQQQQEGLHNKKVSTNHLENVKSPTAAKVCAATTA